MGQKLAFFHTHIERANDLAVTVSDRVVGSQVRLPQYECLSAEGFSLLEYGIVRSPFEPGSESPSSVFTKNICRNAHIPHEYSCGFTENLLDLVWHFEVAVDDVTPDQEFSTCYPETYSLLAEELPKSEHASFQVVTGI